MNKLNLKSMFCASTLIFAILYTSSVFSVHMLCGVVLAFFSFNLADLSAIPVLSANGIGDDLEAK